MARGFHTCLILTAEEAETLGVVRALHLAGFAVLERQLTPAAVAMASAGEFDLVALVCRGSRDEAVIAQLSLSVPVVALLERLTGPGAAASLMAGADACLQLNAEPSLIVAQARAVLRRSSPAPRHGPPEEGLIRVGDISVDLDRCEVQRSGHVIALTPSEFRIVEYLARNPGRISRPHEILNAVTEDYQYLPQEAREVFKVYARRIRRKLEPIEHEPRYLVTVRGFGYRLESPEPSSTAVSPLGMAAS